MFKALEELQKKYPVGSTYHVTWRKIKAWCPFKNDFLYFKNQHPNARNFIRYDNNFITAEEKYEYKVEGYIFDGEYWYLAEQTWDGWQIIDEKECNI